MNAIPADCTVHNVDGLTLVAYPEVIHCSNRGDNHDFIGKTQRIETWRDETLEKVEEVFFWYRGNGKFFHIELREVAA